MKDAFEREINYIRISITDRCDLRCSYCMPQNLESIRHEQVLRFEEVLRICGVMVKLGVKTVRITGGEPFVRKDCMDFLKSLKKIRGIQNIALTTNGVSIEPYLDELAALGLASLNISLDSLSSDIYKAITGSDVFDKVWNNIKNAIELGIRVKINCVPIKGINDSQILPIARLAKELPVDVRFIELMPTCVNGELEKISTDHVLNILKSQYPLLAIDSSSHGFGPAKYFKESGMHGSIGFISALSEVFCAGCNRIRLSSDGFLLLCLHHGAGLDLRAMVRGGASDSQIKAAIESAIQKKPKQHFLQNKKGIKYLSKIGG